MERHMLCKLSPILDMAVGFVLPGRVASEWHAKASTAVRGGAWRLARWARARAS